MMVACLTTSSFFQGSWEVSVWISSSKWTGSSRNEGAFLVELSERLTNTSYTVKNTPFGYFCEWQLDVHGESLAKVYKQV